MIGKSTHALALAFTLAAALPLRAEEADPAPAGLEILLVVGTGGEAEYEGFFSEVAALWHEAARVGGAAFRSIGWEPREGKSVPGVSDESEVADEADVSEETEVSAEGEVPDEPEVSNEAEVSDEVKVSDETERAGGGDPAAPSPDDRDQLEAALRSIEAPEFWLVLVGHGTYDGREIKFNLRGPDVTDLELAEWLEDYEGTLSVINTASASGSFIRKLSAPGRVVVTATKNEAEVSFTRFGRFFAEAIGGLPEADLDNDEQVSLLEAFLHASREAARFYESEGRLATEHALIDDNGDGLGSRAEWFEGTTATREVGSEAGIDGDLARQRVLVGNAFERRLDPDQRARRDALEQEVRQLRRRRDTLPEDEYYPEMEALLLELSRLYHEVGDT